MVLENVAALRHRTGNKDNPKNEMTNYQWLETEFAKLRYHLSVATLSSHNFLLPQQRRRVWMLAELNGSHCNWATTLHKMAAAGQHIAVDKFIA